MPWNSKVGPDRSRTPRATRRESRPDQYFRDPFLLTILILGVLSFFAGGFHRNTPTSGLYDDVTRNCTRMRAAGLSSIPVGHPAYRSWLDADNDGIACEPWNPRWHYR